MLYAQYSDFWLLRRGQVPDGGTERSTQYSDLVKDPMDFQTLEHRLDGELYRSVRVVVGVEQVFLKRLGGCE